MIAATENRPWTRRSRRPLGRGHHCDGLQALLDVADSAASGTGTDIDGRPLRAGALVAGPDGLTITPQAPHDFERAAAP